MLRSVLKFKLTSGNASVSTLRACSAMNVLFSSLSLGSEALYYVFQRLWILYLHYWQFENPETPLWPKPFHLARILKPI